MNNSSGKFSPFVKYLDIWLVGWLVTCLLSFCLCVFYLIGCLIIWLLVGRLFSWLITQSSSFFVKFFGCWLFGQLCCLIVRLVSFFADCLIVVGWWVGWFVSLLFTVQLVGQMMAFMVDWLVGYLVGCWLISDLLVVSLVG